MRSTNKLYERKFILRGECRGLARGLLRFEKAREQINNIIVKNLRFKMPSLILCLQALDDLLISNDIRPQLCLHAYNFKRFHQL